MGVLNKIDSATPARRSLVMCLDGELQAEIDAIEHGFQANVDHDKVHGSMEDPAPTYNAAILRREELRQQIAASEVTFVFERMDPWARVALQAEHPPRPGNPADQARGYNYETYIPAIIRASFVSVTDADGDTETALDDTRWTRLLGRPGIEARDADPDLGLPAMKAVPAVKGALNAGQVDKLATAALTVNEQPPTAPFSGLSLLVTQDSEESSTPPSPGEPPRAGGQGGSRRTSPTSSGGRKKTSKKAAATKASSGRSPVS